MQNMQAPDETRHTRCRQSCYCHSCCLSLLPPPPEGHPPRNKSKFIASELENHQNLRIKVRAPPRRKANKPSSRNKVRSRSLARCRCTLLRMHTASAAAAGGLRTLLAHDGHDRSSVPLCGCCTSSPSPLSFVGPAGVAICGQPAPVLHGLHASTCARSTRSSYPQLLRGRDTPAKPTALSRRRLPRFAQIVEDVEQVHRE